MAKRLINSKPAYIREGDTIRFNNVPVDVMSTRKIQGQFVLVLVGIGQVILRASETVERYV